MVEPGTFAAAAAKFATGRLFKAIADKAKREIAARAYEVTAGAAIGSYPPGKLPPGRDGWNGLVRLLRSDECVEALDLGGAPWTNRGSIGFGKSTLRTTHTWKRSWRR